MSEAAQNDRKSANSEPTRDEEKKPEVVILGAYRKNRGLWVRGPHHVIQLQTLLIPAAEVKPVQSPDFRAL